MKKINYTHTADSKVAAYLARLKEMKVTGRDNGYTRMMLNTAAALALTQILRDNPQETDYDNHLEAVTLDALQQL